MSYLLCILLLFLSCNEQEYSDYSPLAPSDCEYEDITGVCCSTDNLDCNNICNGNSELNCNNLCVSMGRRQPAFIDDLVALFLHLFGLENILF